MAAPIIPPNRVEMGTIDGASLSPRVQQYLEDLAFIINAITGEGDPEDESLILAFILEFAGLHSDPLSMLAIGQVNSLQEAVASLEHQVAALEANISQLRAQAVNQDATLEAIQDSDETIEVRAKTSINENNIRDIFEWAGAATSGAWGY